MGRSQGFLGCTPRFHLEKHMCFELSIPCLGKGNNPILTSLKSSAEFLEKAIKREKIQMLCSFHFILGQIYLHFFSGFNHGCPIKYPHLPRWIHIFMLESSASWGLRGYHHEGRQGDGRCAMAIGCGHGHGHCAVLGWVVHLCFFGG